MSSGKSFPSAHVPPSNHPPTRYFDLLPPELLQAIVKETVRLEPDWENICKDDPSALRALSLVSRRFRNIAQPLLLKTVIFDGPSKWQNLRLLVDLNCPESLGSIRKIVFETLESESVNPDLDRLARLAQSAHRLDHLSIMGNSLCLTSFIGSSRRLFRRMSCSLRR